MKHLALFGSVVLVTLAISVSCSSKKNEGDGDGKGGESSSDGTAAGGVDTTEGGKGAGISVGGASNPGSTVAALPPGSTGLQKIPTARVAEFESKACNGWSVEPEVPPSAIVFVLDVSGTMNSSTDSTGEASKYEVTRDALKSALVDLPDTLEVGLTFYPNKSNGGSRDTAADLSPCIDQSDDVAVKLLGSAGSEQRLALTAALDRVEPDPKGATPTHDAFNIARDMLAKVPTDLGKYVAILTDGQPTLLEGCFGRAAPKAPEDAQPIVEGIAAANTNLGLKTFIVGSPGSEENQGTGEDVRGWLSAAARAGQTMTTQDCSDDGPNFCHLDMTQAPDFGAALTSGLKSIASRVVVKCLYDVPAAPDGNVTDAMSTNLIYGDGTGDSFVVLQNGAKDCDKGWHFINGQRQIEICSSTCTELTSNPKASLNLLFGCSAVTVDRPLL
jgi:hypothetical protein